MKQKVTPSGTAMPGRINRKKRRPFAGMLAIGLAFSFVVSMTSVFAGQSENELALASAKMDVQKSNHHPREKTYMKRKWGVEVLFVRETSAGYMLEFRYKVLDPEKAGPLFERQTKPLLTHDKSGATLIVPTPAKTGALRNSNKPKAGHTYWMFFANPGKLVKPGDQVDVAIGDFHADGIVVQ
jgi:hypothetical protein